MPELRKDPVIGRWVIIATERARRPSDFVPETAKPKGAAECVFCPGNEGKTPPEVLAYRPHGGPWTLRAVPNKFPALQIEGELVPSGEGIYDRLAGVGAHEVIIETPDHAATLATLPEAAVADVFFAYRDRLVDLKKDPRFEYILIFKNHGAAAGASLEHPHSQLIATPILPKMVIEELDGAAQYFRYKERCVWCDIVRQERRDGQRIILDEGGFLALAPFAPRFPFETWVLPAAHQSSYEQIQPNEVEALARLMRRLTGRVNRVLGEPPYNYIIHTAPLREGPLQHFHWHLEFMPKLTRVAGFEWGTGFFINPTPPEAAARFLREGGD
ncbi:MAG: galactose-1-phosphate uridylyltransferase [Candidatus Rokubacteria bacterium]|nr:galactose-1-phosphate uridylyltransferase [Candidatus Rokubacteria bacterium]